MTTLPELLGQGGSAQIWSSSLVVTKGQIVQSPADLSFYKRTAATGSSATDPADDLVNYVAEDYYRVGTLSDKGLLYSTTVPTYYAVNTTRVAPTIAAGVRGLLFSATGRGALYFLGAARQVSATGNFRIEVIVDGRTIFDKSANPTGTSWTIIGSTVPGIIASTNYNDTNAILDSAPVEFRRSISVYVTPTGTPAGVNDVFAYYLRGRN